MTDTVTLILEIIGTIAFAISGALVGIEKRMDILGVAILGATTAVGGGIMRDLLLGSTPPQALQHPLYLIIAVCSAIVIFFSRIRSALRRNRVLFDAVLLVMDSIGLGVFTSVGIGAAKQLGSGMFISAFVGVVTGVGGGVMRDIMSGDIPFVFRKYFLLLSLDNRRGRYRCAVGHDRGCSGDAARRRRDRSAQVPCGSVQMAASARRDRR